MFGLKAKRIGCVRDRSPLILEALEPRLLLSAGNPLFKVLAPLAVVSSPDGNVNVSIYDATGSGAVDASDVKVAFGNNDSVKSISLTGSETMEGLGLVISGATSVGEITDARTAPGEVAFIASDSSITSLSLKSGMSGYDLNDLTLGGITFPTVIDAASATNDTALYCTGSVTSVTLGGAEAGDLVITGENPVSLLSNKTLTINKGGLAGDLVTGGGEGAVTLAGDFTSTMNISGGLGSLTITGGSFSGVLEAGGPVGAISIVSAKAGGVATGGNITSGAAIDVTGADAKSGLSVKSLSVAGAITGATLDLAGGLGALTGGAWTGGTAEAGFAGAITLNGDFGTDFTLGGDLTSLTIKGGDFTGTLSAGGPVGTISVAEAKIGGLAESGGDVTDTAVILISGTSEKTGDSLTSLSATGAISGLSLNISGELGALTAEGWTGGTAAASSAGTITLNGDFDTALTLSGEGGLTSLTIKGGNFSGSLDSEGPVGTISVSSVKGVGGDVSSTAAIHINGVVAKTGMSLQSLKVTGDISGGELYVHGELGALTAGSWTGGEAGAGSAGTVVLNGNFGADVVLVAGLKSATITGGDFMGGLNTGAEVGTVTISSKVVDGKTVGGNIDSGATLFFNGADPKTGLCLGSLTVTGAVTDLTLNTKYGLGSITMGSFDGGSISAPYVESVKVNGNMTDSSFNLNGEDAKGLSLGSATIQGWFSESNVVTTAGTGAISVGGAEYSTLYAGVESGATGLVISSSEFVSAEMIDSFTITGAVKDTEGNSLIGSDIAAETFGTVALRGRIEWDNNGTAFGISGITMDSVSFRDPIVGVPVHYKDLDHSLSYEDAFILIL
jgi:hypothetical protein